MSRVRAAAVVLIMTSAFVVARAVAQTPKAPRTVYTNRTTFSLPVKIDERDRAELSEVKFYVRMVQGGSKGQWVCQETAPPSQSKFTFRAPQDGEYWFAFATLDKAGIVAPTDLDKQPPGLIVVVDTKAPEIDIGPLRVMDGQPILECRVRDEHADPASLKVEYQTPTRSWRALEPVPKSPGQFRLSADGLQCVVRATAADFAGNKSTRETDLSQQPPVAEATASHESAATATLRETTNETEQLHPPRPSPGEQPHVAPLFVNSLRCKLDYALETAGAVRVEAFVTRDKGHSWTRGGEGRSPMALTLPEEGLYGLTLVVSTTGQPAGPPAPGEPPELWLEVDTTKPEVLVQNIQAGSGADSRVLKFSWSVNDRNLPATPVDVFGGPSADGPWQTLVRGLKTSGTAQCTVPTEMGGRIYVRVQCADKAGNVGRWESRDPVVLEGAKPKARVIGVSAGR
jgi:hypothetical protein